MTENNKETIIQSDLSPIFQAVAIPMPHAVLIEELKGTTYPAKRDIRANWFTYAFIAFKQLKEILISEGKQPLSFVTLGTWPWIDAIGAINIFDSLQTVIMTDIDESVLPIAEKNAKKFANKENIVIQALAWSLCEPLKKLGRTYDIIYENLPNIPSTEDISTWYITSSKFTKGSMQLQTDILDITPIKKYLLESHFASLREAKEMLSDGWSLILSIGWRMSYEIIEEMITKSGYGFEELVSWMKLQTEPREILPGYAEAEKEYQIEFDFYRLDDLQAGLQNHGEFPYLTSEGKTLKKDIQTYRISATQANALYQADNTIKIGHIVHILRAIKK